MPPLEFHDSISIPIKKKVSVYSFFLCSGFLDLGFERASGNAYEIRMANEIDANFRRCYQFSREHLDPSVTLRPDFFFRGSIEKLVRWGSRPKNDRAKAYERFANLVENRTLYHQEHIPFNRRMTMAGPERLCHRIAKALDTELYGMVNLDFVSLGNLQTFDLLLEVLHERKVCP